MIFHILAKGKVGVNENSNLAEGSSILERGGVPVRKNFVPS
jgi:hypothetical protein